MGLLDDIKKLRARAESLNNNLGKPKEVEPSKASFNFNIEKPETKVSKELKVPEKKEENFSAVSEALPPNVEEKPRIDSKLLEFRNKARTSSKPKTKSKKSDFFKKPYQSLHDRSKQEDIKENFYESFNIKILIIVVSVILIFTLLRIDIGFRDNLISKSPSGTKFAKVPNDNKAYYLEKSLIVCAGTYDTIREAKNSQNRIKNITEQESKIIKIADYYTIQIGGHYFDKEDAFYVLNELSASGIKDISLRLQ